MADNRKPSGIITVRTKSTIVLPPGPLGFSNLVTPDEYEGVKKFDLFVAYSEAAQDRFCVVVEQHVLNALWDEFLREAKDKAAPKGGWQRPDIREWLDDHLKQPNEKSKVQLPTLKFANAAEYKDRKTGEMAVKSMKAYDAQNKLLNLPALKLGMGSIIQPIVLGGLWISPVQKQPQFSFKLQGVKVHQIVQYGAGGGGNLEETSEEDLALLGDNFQASDLSAYAGGSPTGGQPSRSSAPKQTGFAGDYEDDDEEIPF